ncbi:hypothetical protein FD763_17850, partial [Klebsiella quasipneumoniae]|nr:hypothetical protein [Klebsiella quasipneumoniae]MBQ5276547.1 hypothetical protein [Klebsiella quasipneumoniae]
QLVEHDLAKVGVASSSLVSRSKFSSISYLSTVQSSAGDDFRLVCRNTVNRVIHRLSFRF